MILFFDVIDDPDYEVTKPFGSLFGRAEFGVLLNSSYKPQENIGIFESFQFEVFACSVEEFFNFFDGSLSNGVKIIFASNDEGSGD